MAKKKKPTPEEIAAIEALLAERGLSIADLKPSKKGLTTTNGNDIVRTPDDLALAIVRHYAPTGTILEPCSAGGAFVRAFHTYNNETEAATHEPPPLSQIIEFDLAPINGTAPVDFLTYDGPRVNWLITNPPWSIFWEFLEKAVQVADNIVFLDKMNAWGFTGRLGVMEAADYVFAEHAAVRQPLKPWPQMGMQLSASHIRPRNGEPARAVWGMPIISRIDWTPTKPTLPPPSFLAPEPHPET